MVIGCTVCSYWQCGLLFIQQYLHEYILVPRAAAIEDKLQVRTHREDAGAPPALLFEFIEVVGSQVEAIDSHQTD